MNRFSDDTYGGDYRGLPLFEQRVDGPFSSSTQKPTPEEIAVAGAIWKHKGAANPVPIARIQQLTAYSERQIKGIVEQLIVTHRMRIGARREEPAGYYIIECQQDLDIAVGPYLSQIRSMCRRLAVLLSAPKLRALLTNLDLEK